MTDLNTLYKPTPDQGTTILDTTQYYFSAVPEVNMFRQDGKKICFLRHMFTTVIKQDMAYLDGECELGHPLIRKATADEIQRYRLQTNPREVMEEQLRPQIEAETKDRLENEILAALRARGVTIPDGFINKPAPEVNLLGGVDKAPAAENIIVTATARITPASTANFAAAAKQ